MLQLFIGVGTLCLAAMGFALSADLLYTVGVLAGYGNKAWIYPTLVEGTIALCTLAAFLRHNQPGAWYPWTVGLLGITYSLWVNANPDNVPLWIVRDVPVLCIPLSVHMMLIISGLVDTRTAQHEKLANEQESQGLTIFHDATPEDFQPEGPAPASPAPVEHPSTAHLDAAPPTASPVSTPARTRPRRKAHRPVPEKYLELADQAKTAERQEFWLKLHSAAGAV
ncbi:hypothetical protein QTQ03_20515 [Micromonospora sp. WMMA1363]|uniref:DUF2637 domain-containing protein n=1 Tax=Micromonospora sp. WMMA1363 TaxID=3053985 RepID=UPI00259D1536|nr:DUF2637 domain-containing protein [Micromonospora sp. WMMA1363]MDM4721863.1 hypothetical protein [Micromonospora sp. WMMA1363]